MRARKNHKDEFRRCKTPRIPLQWKPIIASTHPTTYPYIIASLFILYSLDSFLVLSSLRYDHRWFPLSMPFALWHPTDVFAPLLIGRVKCLGLVALLCHSFVCLYYVALSLPHSAIPTFILHPCCYLPTSSASFIVSRLGLFYQFYFQSFLLPHHITSTPVISFAVVDIMFRLGVYLFLPDFKKLFCTSHLRLNCTCNDCSSVLV